MKRSTTVDPEKVEPLVNALAETIQEKESDWGVRLAAAVSLTTSIYWQIRPTDWTYEQMVEEFNKLTKSFFDQIHKEETRELVATPDGLKSLN